MLTPCEGDIRVPRVEQHTTFVSSRGILNSCSAHNLRAISSAPSIDATLLARSIPGGSIYLCTDAVPEFVRSWLPKVEQPFTLVTGDSDLPVAADSLGEAALGAILDNAKCRAWFAQNLAANHPKLQAMPIGLDYHTMWDRPGTWGISKSSPVAQEKQLLDLWARSPEMPGRYLAIYVNWAGTLDRGDRRLCLERVDRSMCFIEPTSVPRASSWSRQAEFLFVLSPEGVGLDCHRTWEALLLGCVPIVRRNSVSVLFDRLPVLIVDDWSEVRRERLMGFIQDLPNRSFDFSPLFLDTWRRRIQGAAAGPALEMTWAAFRQLMTRTTA
jgi:hypothetical protein